MGNSNARNQKPNQAPGQKSQKPNEKNRSTGKEDISHKQGSGTQNPSQPEKNR